MSIFSQLLKNSVHGHIRSEYNWIITITSTVLGVSESYKERLIGFNVVAHCEARYCADWPDQIVLDVKASQLLWNELFQHSANNVQWRVYSGFKLNNILRRLTFKSTGQQLSNRAWRSSEEAWLRTKSQCKHSSVRDAGADMPSLNLDLELSDSAFNLCTSSVGLKSRFRAN